MAKKQDMTYLKIKFFEDNWCPFHGHFSTFAQTKIPTKMDSKSPNFRAFEGLCSKYSQFQKYMKQYTTLAKKTAFNKPPHKMVGDTGLEPATPTMSM